MLAKNIDTLKKELAQIKQGVRKYGARVGEILFHIQEEHLYEQDGCYSMTDWIKDNHELFEYKPPECQKLIQQHIVSLKTDRIAHKGGVANSRDPLSGAVKQELVRLSPKIKLKEGGVSNDVKAIKQVDLKRVLNKASKYAKEDGCETITQRHARRAVDEDLGLDRQREKEREQQKKEEQERQKRYDEFHSLEATLRRTENNLHELIENLRKVPREGWTLLKKKEPKLITNMAKVSESLAGIFRSL